MANLGCGKASWQDSLKSQEGRGFSKDPGALLCLFLNL